METKGLNGGQGERVIVMLVELYPVSLPPGSDVSMQACKRVHILYFCVCVSRFHLVRMAFCK